MISRVVRKMSSGHTLVPAGLSASQGLPGWCFWSLGLSATVKQTAGSKYKQLEGRIQSSCPCCSMGDKVSGLHLELMAHFFPLALL